jgi:hypothetical protein
MAAPVIRANRGPTMNRFQPAALTLLALLAAACPEESRAPDAALEGLDAASPSPDAAPLDAAMPGPDAGPVGNPLRRLVPAHLMGEAPLHNLVFAPHFEPSAQLWYGLTGSGDSVSMLLLTLLHSPVEGLPVLKMLPAGSSYRYLVGTVQGGKAPLLASVWIGRDLGAEETPLNFAIQALVASSPTDSSFSLAAEPDSLQTIESVRWTRYSARIDEDVLGISSIVMQDNSAQPLYFQAPTLVTSQTRALSTARPAQRRAPTLGEAKAVQLMLEELRHRPPPPRVRP